MFFDKCVSFLYNVDRKQAAKKALKNQPKLVNNKRTLIKISSNEKVSTSRTAEMLECAAATIGDDGEPLRVTRRSLNSGNY
jgi:hypothetical protein